jgi:repressor LexA
MIDAGINDGDVLIIQKAEKCANGEIVIAFWNEAATVKRFYLEPGHYRLQPENPELNPIMIKKDDPTFRIIGRVKALIRKF